MSGAQPPPRMSPRRPWYREPYVWLVVCIPLSAVVVGMVMLWLSIASYDGLVADDYYKRGLEINRVLDRDRTASRLGLVADLHADPGATRVLLTARDAGFVMPPSLTLELSYATRAGLDRRVVLAQRAPGEFEGPALPLAKGRWYVEVSAADWRLTGALASPGSGRLSLGPRRIGAAR